MNYELYEPLEINSGSEILEDGVLLEHFIAEGVIEDMESAELYGTPVKDAEVWSMAETINSDGLLCEKYIAELLTGDKITENELCEAASDSGYYNNEYGSTLYDVGKHLESLELEVTRESSLSIKELCEALDNGEKVICAISSISLYYPEISGIPSLSADRFVEVIGVDMTDTQNKMIVVNDPLDECGGTSFPLDDFVDAWQKSNCYCVIAKNHIGGNTV